MQHILSKNRHQIEFTSLEDLIEADNTIRFVNKLELNKLGFTLNTLKKEVRIAQFNNLSSWLLTLGYLFITNTLILEKLVHLVYKTIK